MTRSLLSILVLLCLSVCSLAEERRPPTKLDPEFVRQRKEFHRQRRIEMQQRKEARKAHVSDYLNQRAWDRYDAEVKEYEAWHERYIADAPVRAAQYDAVADVISAYYSPPVYVVPVVPYEYVQPYYGGYYWE